MKRLIVLSGGRARRWAAYVAGGTSAFALLLCPLAPSFGQTQSPQKAQAFITKTNTNQVVRQTPTKAPVQAINVYQPPKHAAEPANHTKETSADVWMVRLTALLVIAGFIQVAIFAAQLFIGYNQLRAYVFLEDAKISVIDGSNNHPPIEGATWMASYVVKNAGVTPAHRVKVLDSLTVENCYPTKLPIPNADDYLGSMAPGGDFIDSESRKLTLLHDDNAAITRKTATKAVFLVGRISYQDVFHFAHKTDFCFYWTGPVGNEPLQMTAYDKGNDST